MYNYNGNGYHSGQYLIGRRSYTTSGTHGRLLGCYMFMLIKSTCNLQGFITLLFLNILTKK